MFQDNLKFNISGRCDTCHIQSTFPEQKRPFFGVHHLFCYSLFIYPILFQVISPPCRFVLDLYKLPDCIMCCV